MSQADREVLGYDALIRPAMLDVNVDDVSESQQLQWIRSTIADVATVQSGMGFPKSFQGKVEDKYPVYKVGDVSRSVLNNRGNLAIAGNSVSEMEATKLKGIIFPEGTTLFAKIGEAVRLNRRAFVVKPGLADNNVMGVKPLLREMDKIIYYLMRTVDLNEVSRSTTVPSIRKSDIEDLIFNIPPIAEQQQITAKLDELLAQVDNLKTRLDTIPKILKRFRQSVLAAAVSGKLTEKRDEALWQEKKLEDVCISISDGDHQAPPRSKTGIPFLVISNISKGKIDFSNIERWVPEDYYFSLKAIRVPQRNDILYTVTGSFGIPVLVDTDEKFCFQRHIAIIKPNSAMVNYRFLQIILGSLQGFKQAESVATGTAQKTVSLKGLRNFIFEFPALEEQTEIVARVERLFALADQIEQRVNDAQSRVNHLTQAILAKAFRGELTADWRAQNPELINGENSAEALLARIKAEREQIQTVKKAKM